MSNPEPIRNLSDLKREKIRLAENESRIKLKLAQRFEFYKTNYKSLIWNSVNPFKNKQEISFTLLSLAKETILPSITGESNEVLGQKSDQEIVGLVIKKIFSKFKKKKNKKRNTTKKV